MMAFCWLPPENWPIGRSIARGRDSDRASKLRSRWRAPAGARSRAVRSGASRQPDVAADRAARDDALAFALFGQEAEAGGDRRARAAEGIGLTVDADLARVGPVDAGDQAQSSVRPAPTRPEMPSTSPLRSLKLASRTAVPAGQARRPRGRSRPWRIPCVRRWPARDRPCAR